MSEMIFQELKFLGSSIVTGAFLLLLYDGFRIMRRVIPHKKGFVNIEDFVYWLAVTFFVFSLLCRENDGGIRWFAVLGIFSGMLIYSFTVSPFIVRFFSLILGKVAKGVLRIWKIIRKPLYIFKKRLKKIWKTIRMVIRKR